MLEDGRCSLCEIPEHHSTKVYPSTTVPVAPVPATPSTVRRHALHHVHQKSSVPERKLHSHHAPDTGDLRLHSNHIRHSSSPGAASVHDHKHHTLSQFTNLIYTPRHAIKEEPIYNSSSRHAVNEEPTFLQELSSYMKKNHHSYDGGSSRNLNNNDLNSYNQNPNALSDEPLYGYSKEPSYKLNNLPSHHLSRSNSYNSQILNAKALYTPNSRVYESNKSNTLPTNMLSGRHASHVSSLQDLDQDYFLNMPRSRFSFDGIKKRETKKQRITVQSVMLIGCFSLLFVVGIIMFVAVCYQNGWLGLGQEDPQEDFLPRRRNELNRRYDPTQNFPDNVYRQRGTGSGRIRNEYPHIGLSGGRRQQPSIYEDRVYQQSPQFARRIGHQGNDNNHLNNPIEEIQKPYLQSPQFERLVDEQVENNHLGNNPIDELPQVTGPVDNHPIPLIPSSSSHDGDLAREDLQASLKLAFAVNEKENFDKTELNINSERPFPQERLVINVPHHTIELSHNDDENENFDNTELNINSERPFPQERLVINVPHHTIEQPHNKKIESIPVSKIIDEVAKIHGLETELSINSERPFLQERLVINVPHHTIELSHNEKIESIPVSKVKEDVAKIHRLETTTKNVLIDQTNKSLIVKSDISHENPSPPSRIIGSKSNPLQNHENTSTPSSLKTNKTVPLEALKFLLEDGPSRSKILNVVAGAGGLISSD